MDHGHDFAILEALEHQPCRMSPALSCPQEGLKKLDGTPSKIASSCFCRDADLGAFSCRDGKFEFVSLFGMTKDETEAMFALEAKMCWNSSGCRARRTV